MDIAMQPAATLLLNCYNHEKFVRAAVRSAFSQTFSPLEILITDNCSRDGTFAVLQEEAAAYRGPHVVRLERTEQNIGEVRLLTRVMEQARGEVFVLASGDDIQHADRVERQVAVLRAQGVSLAAGQLRVIDARGTFLTNMTPVPDSRPMKPQEILDHNLRKTVAGAGFAWTRDIFDRFPPLDPHRDSWSVDRTLDLRAILMRGVYFMADPVVDYRRHDSNLSKTIYDESATELVNDEKVYVYKILTQSARLAALTAYGLARPDDARIEPMRNWMRRWLCNEIGQWALARSRLAAAGLHSRWLDHPMMAAGLPGPPGKNRPGRDGRDSLL